jgi:DNA-binding CsgD family transcriptional regulator
VIVQDPAEPARLPTQALAELYGLTPAESRVIEHIAHGQTPQHAADELGVNLTTVKTHLQKIFAKTNTARQADLVQLLARATPPLRNR